MYISYLTSTYEYVLDIIIYVIYEQHVLNLNIYLAVKFMLLGSA